MKVPSSPESIANAVWEAGEILKELTPPHGYMPYLLALFFLKVLSSRPEHSHGEENDSNVVDKNANLTREASRLIVPNGCTFEALYNVRQLAGNAKCIDTALNRIVEQNTDKLEGVFQPIQFTQLAADNIQHQDGILRRLLEALSKPFLHLAPVLNTHPDWAGEAVDLLLHRFASASSKTQQDFHTSSDLATLLARLAVPKAGESVYDPACGTGHTLSACGAYIRATEQGKSYSLFGQAPTEILSSIAKMQLLLHGEDNYHLAYGDTVRDPQFNSDEHTLQQFDVVVSNPPFSVEDWAYGIAEDDPFNRFERGIPPKTRGNYALILHILASMKSDTGRAFVIVPHGVLFRGAGEADIRRSLIQDNLVDAVIGLPEKLLYNASIPIAVLVLKKNKPDSNILFMDASDAFVYGRTQNMLNKELIESITDIYANRKVNEARSALISNNQVLENEANLNIALYVQKPTDRVVKDVTSLIKEREQIKEEIYEIEQNITETLRNLELK